MIPGSSGASSQEGGGETTTAGIVTPTTSVLRGDAPVDRPPSASAPKGPRQRVVLLAATFLSLTLANCGATSNGVAVVLVVAGGTARIQGIGLSLQGWTNEGLMAIADKFVVGLEIKLELRHGSLSSVRKALLPCIAALGGMLTPMAVYRSGHGHQCWRATPAALTGDEHRHRLRRRSSTATSAPKCRPRRRRSSPHSRQTPVDDLREDPGAGHLLRADILDRRPFSERRRRRSVSDGSARPASSAQGGLRRGRPRGWWWCLLRAGVML